MTEIERYFLMAFGALLAIVGIVLFARKSGSGQNKLKFFGAEFELSAPSLVIFVLGCGLVVFPFIQGVKQSQATTPPQPKPSEIPVASGPVSDQPTALVEHADQANASEMQAQQDALMKKLEDMERKLSAKASAPDPMVANVRPQTVNVAGEWESDAGDMYIFAQVGNRVTFREVNLMSGVTAAGEGTINGRRIQLQYTTFVGTTGSAQFTVGEDNDELSGSFTDHVSGMSQALYLTR